MLRRPAGRTRDPALGLELLGIAEHAGDPGQTGPALRRDLRGAAGDDDVGPGPLPVDPGDRRYTDPLRRDAACLAERLHPGDAAVLLGSIATAKYLQPLNEVLGARLHVPQEFIGRGDMSRGALMLRCAAEGRELTYIAAPPHPS